MLEYVHGLVSLLVCIRPAMYYRFIVCFQEFPDFIQAVDRRGVGAMELVAMDMKLRGTYIARQLSFHGVQFKVETVPIDDSFRDIYNDSVKLVCPHVRLVQVRILKREQRRMSCNCRKLWTGTWICIKISKQQSFSLYNVVSVGGCAGEILSRT